MANDMNRRGFLKYAAASALGMGALGVMTGCSSKETASSSAPALPVLCTLPAPTPLPPRVTAAM